MGVLLLDEQNEKLLRDEFKSTSNVAHDDVFMSSNTTDNDWVDASFVWINARRVAV